MYLKRLIMNKKLAPLPLFSDSRGFVGYCTSKELKRHVPLRQKRLKRAVLEYPIIGEYAHLKNLASYSPLKMRRGAFEKIAGGSRENYTRGGQLCFCMKRPAAGLGGSTERSAIPAWKIMLSAGSGGLTRPSRWKKCLI